MVDTIYRLSDCDKFNIKKEVLFLRTLSENKQAIFFVHHIENLNINIDAFVEEFDPLMHRKYYEGTPLDERDQIRKEFENGVFKFLFATPNMYDINSFFQTFVHDQIMSDKILIGL